MTLIKYEPLRNIERLHERIQQYFDDFSSFGFNFNLSESFSPKIDISEDNETVNVVAEIPGVKKENIKITVQDNILTLEGEKKKEESKKESNFFRTERTYGSFKRSFTLPSDVDTDKVDAKFENGILHVRLKKFVQKPKTEKVIELK